MYLRVVDRKLETYQIKDWTVFGRTFFRAPFKVSDELYNEARIVMVIHGNSTLYSADKKLDLCTGDVIVMKSDHFVNDWKEDKHGEWTQVIVFQLTSDLLQHLYGENLPKWFSYKSGENASPVEKVAPSFLLDNFKSTLQYYLDNHQMITEEVSRIKIRELVSILVETDKNGKIKALFGQLFYMGEHLFHDVIRTHLYQDLGIDDLAFLAGLSTSSFNRKFKAHYGTSPTKYIISKRLERAKLLLSTTDQRISEVAYDCGFNDFGYFSRTFKKHYNISPSDFRK